jgi:DNA-binding NtrC family response regulator
MERAVVLAENEEITLDVISEEIKSKSLTEKGNAFREDYLMVPSSQAFKDARKDFEKKYIEKCLEKTGGNITQAAAQMGMHRQSLQHKIKELGLNKKYVLSE